MFNKVLHKLKTVTPWRILWLSVVLSEFLTEIIVALLSILIHGRITYDYLIVGSITAFFVSIIVAAILVLLIKELRKNERTQNELNRRLFDLSIRDDLTDVYNRRHFYEKLEEEIKRSERYGTVLSLIMLDIDYFKNYNDTHGHQAGDSVLRDVALLLRNNVREQDLIARYGGEEFAIILPETGKQVAGKLAERIRGCLSAQAFHFKETLPSGKLTISLGVATFPEDAKSLNDLVETADQALYKAKEKGRNRVALVGEA